MNVGRTFVAAASVLVLTACGNLEGANLIFGQKHTVGLTVAGSSSSADAELTLGYSDRDIAFVPVALKKPDGSYELITAETEGANGGELTDAMSVLGQFEFQAGSGGGNVGGAGPSAVLGKFFATGAAAQVLAQGFANKLSGGGAADANSQ